MHRRVRLLLLLLLFVSRLPATFTSQFCCVVTVIIIIISGKLLLLILKFFLQNCRKTSVQAVVTLPQPLPVSTAPPPTLAPATFPSTAYLPPIPTAAPSTAPPPVVIVEPIRPVTIPAFIAPATTAPATLPPVIVTQAPISFPPRPTVGPVVVDPPVMNMALMPQLPTVQMAQIVSLDVVCAKESMVVKIKFDRSFGGLIYSKVITWQKRRK